MSVENFACGAIGFLEEALNSLLQNKSFLKLNGAFFVFFSCRYSLKKTSVLTKENLISKFSYIAFKPPDLSPHRLTIYKIFKATYNFHSKTQFPLKHQQYYRISFTDKIHN